METILLALHVDLQEDTDVLAAGLFAVARLEAHVKLPHATSEYDTQEQGEEVPAEHRQLLELVLQHLAHSSVVREVPLHIRVSSHRHQVESCLDRMCWAKTSLELE